MDQSKQLNEFNKLEYSERKEIAMNIITNLKDKGNQQAQRIFDYVSGLDAITDDLLESIYLDFIVSIEKIKKEKITEQLHVFDKALSTIERIRYEEEAERVNENPDDILNQI